MHAMNYGMFKPFPRKEELKIIFSKNGTPLTDLLNKSKNAAIWIKLFETIPKKFFSQASS